MDLKKQIEFHRSEFIRLQKLQKENQSKFLPDIIGKFYSTGNGNVVFKVKKVIQSIDENYVEVGGVYVYNDGTDITIENNFELRVSLSSEILEDDFTMKFENAVESIKKDNGK